MRPTIRHFTGAAILSRHLSISGRSILAAGGTSDEDSTSARLLTALQAADEK